MAKEKGIFEDERRELPDEPYVTLTEALTWIVAGDCRGDNYLARMWPRQGNQNQRDWGSRYGPAWLLRHLELLTNGEEWPFDESVAEEDRQSTLRQFEKAKNWLAANGADPVAAYKRVKDRCDHDRTEAARFESCEAMIFKACAASEVKLVGIRYDDATVKWDGVHTAIPYTYFLQPVFHRIGSKPEGAGWGHLVEADLTPATRPEYDDILRDDSRPSYREVMMHHDDVLMLRERFQVPEGRPVRDRARLRSRPFSQSAARQWYKDRVANWDPTRPHPSTQADWNAAREVFPAVPRETVRDLRRKYAPTEWKKRGRRRPLSQIARD